MKRNYSQMTTKKLNALLETATDEQRKEIEEVLAKREAVANPTSAPATQDELSDEEKAAIAAAEAEAPAAPAVDEKKKGAPKKERITDEERIALATKLRAEAVDHRCRVVPFNSIEWVDGTIVSIIEEKKNNKVLFAVKADDGRRIVKAHDSQLIEVLEETVERAKRTRGSKTQKLDEEGNPINEEITPWTDEEIEEAISKVIDNVGKTVSFPEAGAYGQIAENAATLTGRIISLVPAKRTKTILYRIDVDQPNAPEGAPKKYAHKVSTLDSLEIAEELDEVGAQINLKFRQRRYKEEAETTKLNKKQRFDLATDNLAKAKANLEKQMLLVQKREKELEEAKKAYEEAIANGETFEEPEAEAASSEEAEDLM